MSKEQLVEAVAQKCGITKVESKKCIETVFGCITDCLKKGDKVMIMGFGIFKVVHRKQRRGINPKTKQPITIPASKAPVFKCSKVLKEMCN